jgi:aryl-alcohol dehydrogenase-like predicted oxidoreductase
VKVLARLGLGSAQFGSDYGLSNRLGRPNEKAVADIVQGAVEAGIGYVDTAPSYGEAEGLIGRYLPAGHKVRIVTKLPPIAAAAVAPHHTRQLLDAIAASLDKLRITRLHGLLVHQTTDLTKPGWQHVVDTLREAQGRGWVNRIGASIYGVDQLALVVRRFVPELIQIPVSVLDRRLIQSSTFARLAARGTEVHARSVFLQGLLLMAADDLPRFFAPIRARLAELHKQWATQGLDPLAGCLGFVLARREIDAVVVGVNRRAEFDEIAAIIGWLAKHPVDVGPVPVIDPSYLDPVQWPASRK